MAKILVTGGCGFIGSHICDKLNSLGHDVVAFDNLSSGKKDNLTTPVEVVVGDITKASDVASLFDNHHFDAVIHCAAQVMLRKSLDDPINDAMQNIIGTITILEACRKHGIKRFVYASTGGARYGLLERLPAKEDDVIFPIAPYGISKHTAEHYVFAYERLCDMDPLILCFGNVYGPRDGPHNNRVIPLFYKLLRNGKAPTFFGDGKQTRDFLYVEDIADVISKWLFKKTPSKMYNLGSGVQMSMIDVFNFLESELKTGLKPTFEPPIKGEVQDNVLDITKASTELHFEPTPFSKGMVHTLKWLEKNV